jgi:hypothetical protein
MENKTIERIIAEKMYPLSIADLKAIIDTCPKITGNEQQRTLRACAEIMLQTRLDEIWK